MSAYSTDLSVRFIIVEGSGSRMNANLAGRLVPTPFVFSIAKIYSGRRAYPA